MRKIYILLCFIGFSTMLFAQERDETCDPVDSLIIVDTMGSITILWNMNDTALAYNYRYRLLGDTSWTTTNSTLDTFIVIEEDDDCIEYEVGIRTVCPFDTSGFTLDTIISFCPMANNDYVLAQSEIKLYPVPFSDRLTIQTNATDLQVDQIRVYSMSGELIAYRQSGWEDDITTVDWPQGMYLVEVETNRGRHVSKVLKLNR